MKFSNSHKINFNAEVGAYSKITPTEFKDSQVTAKADEKSLLVDYYGKNNIFKGGAKSNPEAALKVFKIYPTGEEVGLNLVYPKPKKNELRLYLSSEAGFKPESGAVLFMFVRDKDLWIGALPESEWSELDYSLADDDSDFIYQASLNESNDRKRIILKERDTYQRDREKALAAIDASGYQCENDNSHALFTSHATKRPYLEAHHLIPMCLEPLIKLPLDVSVNIFSLCPSCHRAIHYSEKDLSRKIIDNLVENRPEVLGLLKNGINDLYEFYEMSI